MQGAETLSKRRKRGPGRARLKLRRHPTGSALSAHLFLRRLLPGVVAPLFSHRFEFIESRWRQVRFYTT